MDSKGLKMPASESAKMVGSVFGSRFSEKAEHLPIKKRRFLFRASSPPLNTTSSEGTENVATCLHSSSQEVQPKPDSCPPVTSSIVSDLLQSGSIDSKVDREKFVKASKKASEDDSLVAIAAVTVKLEADSEILDNMSAKGTDLHTSTAPFKDITSSIMGCSSPDKATVDNSTPDESTLDNSTPNESTLNNSCSHVPSESEGNRMNQVTSNTQTSAALDDRLNWDLNTVMDAWEEPLECDHDSYTADAACSNKEGNSEGCEQGRENRSVSENIGNNILPLDLKSLPNIIEESELEECKAGCNGISNLLPPVIPSAPHVAISKIKSSHNEHVGSSTDAIPFVMPNTLTLGYPACDVSAKHVNVNRKSTNDLSSPMAVGTDFSLDYSIPPGFDHCINMRALEDNVISSTIVESGNNVNPTVTTVQTTENEKLNLSLVTGGSLENGVEQSGNTFDEDDKAEIRRTISNNRITMANLVGKGTESSQDPYKGDHKALNQTTETVGSLPVVQSLVLVKTEDQPATVSSIHDVVCSDAEVPIKDGKSPVTSTSGKPFAQQTETIYHIPRESHTDFPNDPVSENKEVCEVPLDNGFGFENFPSDIQAGSEVDNVDELSVGCDSQFEDGELRESSIQTWEGYEGDDRENEHGRDNRGTSFHLGTFGADEHGSQYAPESSSGIRSTDVGSQRGAVEISSVLLLEKLDSSERVSLSEPNETTNSTIEVSMKDASQSDQWKMNVSGLDLLPEDHSSLSNTKMTDFSGIKYSRIGRYGPETEDLETKAEGSRFCRREPLSRIVEPSTRDTFFNRGRFQMQGCSSHNADDSGSRSVRESGVLRSVRRGNYPRQIPASGRGGGTWNGSPGRDRDLNHLHPSFRRSLLEDVASVDNLTNKVGVDPKDNGAPGASSYVTRQSFRSRLLTNREDDFRARLGLRPSGETCQNRFLNVGRGRSLRYGSRHNGGGPRGQYYGPANDDYDEPSMEYSHSFPSRRRCFSPTEQRVNHPCAHHHSGSTSPPRSRTRSPTGDDFRRRNSRSPNLRPDTRMRRPRSPNYHHGFEADHVGGYNMEPRNNNSPPSSRWVKYKQRTSVFDRRSPPPGRINPPIGERLDFYDPSRKTKQNETYRSGHPGRFSELHGAGRGGPRYVGSDGDLTDRGYRRGGFVRHYDMGRPVKHIQYDEEDVYGPVYNSRDKESLEFHGRGNPKPYSSGTDSRFHNPSRRPREERENW